MTLRTCVAPSGKFVFGIHAPSYTVENLRESDTPGELGALADGTPIDNRKNFPPGEVRVPAAEMVFEVANPFPFRGTTYILKKWADEKAGNIASIRLPPPPEVSLAKALDGSLSEEKRCSVLAALPSPLRLSLAATSTDPEDLIQLSTMCCEFVRNESHRPVGLRYEPAADGSFRPVIRDRILFEVLANNHYLPADLKEVMVLRPGAQGGSEIVGESGSPDGKTHVYEYLRGNSYIPWGHYAANMGPESIRYRIADLTPADMSGMRHLYYQRVYTEMARMMGIALPGRRRAHTVSELETLREQLLHHLAGADKKALLFNSTLWGWNFGFDYAPSHYRLHASHQQIHQQFALLPARVSIGGSGNTGTIPSFACGDSIQAFIRDYYRETGKLFFGAYVTAIRSNTRMDANPSGEKSLIVFEDSNCMVFVPKAQTSQWELNLMTVNPVGNILEANSETRASLDRAMLIAVKALSALGAQMITSFEYSKRFDEPDTDQRLLYSFLPRLPESPGAFSEAQLRWINGHYPEDFAAACRKKLPEVSY
ncbi:MAG: hypothetical protein V2B19_11645 [Pseudomonadota bacterium]